MIFLLISSVIVLGEVKGIIGPISSRYFIDLINYAENINAEAAIITLDTPGGFDDAMRDIVQAELNANIPIVIYVYPSGARDASAGVFITLASHIAVMSPGTNIGAATPVAFGTGEKIDESLKKKMINDAAAYIKSIAEKRKRNTKWAVDAVLNASSITANDALKMNVIDLISNDIDELIEKIDGYEVELPGGKKILKTKDVMIEKRLMSFKDLFLTRISNPNIAYILMVIGIYGLIFEITHPGAIIPGVIGALCLIVSFFSFQTLPINYAGLALIILGVIMFILEVLTPTNGPLTIGGLISMFLGSLMLVKTDVSFLKISLPIIIGAVGTTAIFLIIALTLVVRSLKRKPETGKEGMIGLEGEAITDIHKDGTIYVRGEYWNAYSDEKIKKGENVVVLEVNGFKLKVKKKEE
uniref:Nodulation protein NfeD n=1 Tax=candidate division WOR-3 bacterium TaxID=2052148 RepID=A0A7C4U941_UNCW3